MDALGRASQFLCDYEFPVLCVRIGRESVELDYQIKGECVGQENTSVCPPPPPPPSDVSRCERAGMSCNHEPVRHRLRFFFFFLFFSERILQKLLGDVDLSLYDNDDSVVAAIAQQRGWSD